MESKTLASSRLEDGTYYINYTGVSALGVVTCLARTHDFQNVREAWRDLRSGQQGRGDFPRARSADATTRCIDRRLSISGNLAIWLASSDNLLDWGHHQAIIGPRPGKWDGERVGAGASPIRTAEGWLELYHGCDENTRYCTGALLLDLNEALEGHCSLGGTFSRPGGTLRARRPPAQHHLSQRTDRERRWDG